MDDKEIRLLEVIRRYPSVMVAYSGGLDSALVLWASVKALGVENVWAVTSDSDSYASGEADEARKIAVEVGLPSERHIFITTSEMSNPNYSQNPSNRCYFCKGELFTRLKDITGDKAVETIFDGANLSDLGDYRPGRQAAQENGVISPLIEAEMTKEDVRSLARRYHLSFSEKPAAACLSSRIPHGTAITVERLRQIDIAETEVRQLGFVGFRVRYHNDVARLELRPEDLPRVLENGMNERLVAGVKKAGFRYVALDLEGYRQGSLNPINTAGENDGK